MISLLGLNLPLALLTSFIALSWKKSLNAEVNDKAKKSNNINPKKDNEHISINIDKEVNQDKTPLRNKGKPYKSPLRSDSMKKSDTNFRKKNIEDGETKRFKNKAAYSNRNKQRHGDYVKTAPSDKENCMDLCLIGKYLILSGAEMEENLGKFLGAEARKAAVASKRLTSSNCSKVSIGDLIELNNSVKGIICCLSSIEEEIMKKIKTGERILNDKDLCKKCKSKDYESCTTFSDVRFLKELRKIDLCLLGKKLILSGAIFEENLAAFLEAEAEKIDAAVDKFKKHHCDDVSIKDLMEINKSIKDSICCLAEIEENIVAKIKLGEKLLYEKDPCKDHCKDHDHHEHDKNDHCEDDCDYDCDDDCDDD